MSGAIYGEYSEDLPESNIWFWITKVWGNREKTGSQGQEAPSSWTNPETGKNSRATEKTSVAQKYSTWSIKISVGLVWWAISRDKMADYRVKCLIIHEKKSLWNSILWWADHWSVWDQAWCTLIWIFSNSSSKRIRYTVPQSLQKLPWTRNNIL